MYRIRGLEEVEKVGLGDEWKVLLRAEFQRILAAFEELGDYDPDRDGELVMLENGEEVDLPEPFNFGPLATLLFEFVERHTDPPCFVATYIPTNNWGLTIVIPDSDQLDPQVRDFLFNEENLSDADERHRN